MSMKVHKENVFIQSQRNQCLNELNHTKKQHSPVLFQLHKIFKQENRFIVLHPPQVSQKNKVVYLFLGKCGVNTFNSPKF